MNFFVFFRNLRSNSNSDVKSCDKTSRESDDMSTIEDNQSITPEIVEEIMIVQPLPVLTDQDVEGQVVIARENVSKSPNNYMNSENPLNSSRMFPAKNNLQSPRSAIASQTAPSVSRPSLTIPSSSTGRNSGSGRPSFNLVSQTAQDDIIVQEKHEKSKANHYTKLGQNFVQTGGGSSSILNSSSRMPGKLHSSQITKTTKTTASQ